MNEVAVKSSNRLSSLAGKFDKKNFLKLTEHLTFDSYLDKVFDDTRLARTAYQRVHDMIMEQGAETFERYGKTLTRFNFFTKNKKAPVYGLEENLEQLVKAFRGAAYQYGTERRLLLLQGPVGSSKSTICTALKSGLEKYTQSDNGAIYTYKWINLDKFPGLYLQKECPSAMFNSPLCLCSSEQREQLSAELTVAAEAKYQKELKKAKAENPDVDPTTTVPKPYKIRLTQNLNPRCQYIMDELLQHYNGNWDEVIKNHIVVYRYVFSEKKRVGIGTFQPKDEKNQDSTELTGDINYRALQNYGVDSDPRAFSYDGEFLIANNGICEFIEVFKLAKEFLYDILGATQERQVKPKKFSQVDIDEVLISHSNFPEFEKILNDRTMEALRDRTVMVPIPYLKRWSDELKVLEKDYGKEMLKSVHLAPHTLEVASLWAILTRLNKPKDGQITLVEKAKLYDDRSLPGWTEDRVKEMLDDNQKTEGLKRGISARYVQNKISAVLTKNHNYVNPFMLLNELEEGLDTCSLITSEEDREYYRNCIAMAKGEFDNIAKNEVQKALVADENAIVRLCENYLQNLFAYINGSKIKDKYTKKDVDPDERLMRSIEEKADVHEQVVDDFRRSIAAFVGNLANKGQKFQWNSHPKLQKALEQKLFDDVKDTINLAKFSDASGVVDPDVQEKLDAIKTRLIKNFGYNEESASDLLEYVSSVFARGDVSE